MKRKTIDSMREVRLWVTQLIVPIGAGALWLDHKYPNLKYDIKRGFNRKVDEIKLLAKDIKNKFRGQK